MRDLDRRHDATEHARTKPRGRDSSSSGNLQRDGRRNARFLHPTPHFLREPVNESAQLGLRGRVEAGDGVKHRVFSG